MQLEKKESALKEASEKISKTFEVNAPNNASVSQTIYFLQSAPSRVKGNILFSQINRLAIIVRADSECPVLMEMFSHAPDTAYNSSCEKL